MTALRKTVFAAARRGPKDSGLRRRIGSDVVVTVVGDASALIARASTVRTIFPDLIAIVGRLGPLRAAAIVPRDPRRRPVVWTAQPADRDLAQTEAVAAATLAHFGDDRSEEPCLHDPDGSMCWVTFPIARAKGEEIVGVLAVAAKNGRVPAHDVEVIALIADKLAPLVQRPAEAAHLSLDGATLPRRAERRASVLRELTTRVFETLDYGATLGDVACILGERAGNGCIIRLSGDPPLRFAYPAKMEDAEVSRVIDSLFVTVGITGKPLFEDRAPTRFACALLGFETLACIPLLARGRVVGVMCVVDADASLLAPSDLEELGRRIGAAVHNGRAYETALASLRAREQVLSAVSHDLQNPLSTILMSAARMLQDGEREGTTARPQLERIHRSAARMRRLVGDLLDVAAIESGALAINPTDCSLADLAREVIDGATVAASDAGVTLVDEIAESDHRLHADPERALQVLRNLVGNAIKFTPPGGTVTLRAFRTGTMVAVQVVDTGIGIADSELPRIFDRFWQAEPARRLGTGLGLAICKSLVERWDGTIRASSAADAGTTITFTVPCADEESTADRSA